jgi:hypothetical protein
LDRREGRARPVSGRRVRAAEASRREGCAAAAVEARRDAHRALGPPGALHRCRPRGAVQAGKLSVLARIGEARCASQ